MQNIRTVNAILKICEKYNLSIYPNTVDEIILICKQAIEIPNATFNYDTLLKVAQDIIEIRHISYVEAIQLYYDSCKKYSYTKRPLSLTPFVEELFGKGSTRYKKKLEFNQSFASCNFEAFAESYVDKELAKKDFKKKYGSLNIDHIKEKYKVSEKDALAIIKERTTRAILTLKSRPIEEQLLINKSKASTQENFIKKHGESEGTILYQKLLDRKVGIGTLDYYISKYGEAVGTKKYTDIIAKRNRWVIEYWLNLGYTKEDAEKQLKEVFDKRGNFSLDYCIEKYGKKEGKKVWKERQDKWQNTLNSKPQEELDRINKSKASTLDNCILKYGEEQGKIKYSEILSKKGQYRVSKSSLRFFIPIYKELRRMGIVSKKEVYWGITGSKEYFINKDQKIRFYDFTILYLKIIIEYNGVVFHPKSGEENWKSAYGTTYKEGIEYDRLKRKMAEEQGFMVYYVWEDEDPATASSRILNEIISIYTTKETKNDTTRNNLQRIL